MNPFPLFLTAVGNNCFPIGFDQTDHLIVFTERAVRLRLVQREEGMIQNGERASVITSSDQIAGG